MSLGIIRQGNKVYSYEADFDETSQKWYGEVGNRQGETVHTTKAEFATYQDAILAVQAWIKSKLESAPIVVNEQVYNCTKCQASSVQIKEEMSDDSTRWYIQPRNHASHCHNYKNIPAYYSDERA